MKRRNGDGDNPMQTGTDEAQRIPGFESDREDIDRAYRIAINDINANIKPFQSGLLTAPAPCIIAGVGYNRPWTRDTAINVWNGAGLLFPEASKNTLLSVLIRDEWGVRVGGQYWDAIIWAVGAWHYWLYTGDRDFCDLARETVVNSLKYYEEMEYDATRGLFRGPACYGDGVAAYPDRYAVGSSSILAFRDARPEKCAGKGYGMPMFVLSTNCLYCEAYRVAQRLTGDDSYGQKAESLKAAINDAFWDEKRGTYRYLMDDEGTCDAQEALGLSFAVLFGVASPAQSARVVENACITPNGIPCLSPNFRRYEALGLGRHSGTIWPHAQAFWGEAAAEYRPEALERELLALTRNALRNGFFSEIYHPQTGLPYGGVQEEGGVMRADWRSQPQQTWSATGYLRMLLFGLLGLRFEEGGVRLSPRRLEAVGHVRLTGLRWRGMTIDIEVCKAGFDQKTAFIPWSAGRRAECVIE